jgi:hypothetical protein
MKISQTKKNKGDYCCAYGCKEKPNPKKGGLCHKHYARKLKEKDPVYARYNQFCSKATSRGIENSVTLEQFRKFCEDENYIISKGRRGQNATIDRLCNIHGYHIWNMRIKTNRHNASKGNRFNGDNFDCPF